MACGELRRLDDEEFEMNEAETPPEAPYSDANPKYSFTWLSNLVESKLATSSVRVVHSSTSICLTSLLLRVVVLDRDTVGGEECLEECDWSAARCCCNCVIRLEDNDEVESESVEA